MDIETFKQLLDKANKGLATPEEKLALLKEINAKMAEFNQILKKLTE